MRCHSTQVILAISLATGCGGGVTQPPPPPPPPPPDLTRNAAAHAGGGQTASVGQAVAVPPAVRITNAAGAPVAGVTITFAVTGGGGSLTGPTPATGSDGVAAVGSWVLGAVGANALTATVAGATAGSPVQFSATGREVVIQPAGDTTLSGLVSVTRLVVPAGVTVTVRDSLILRADSTVTIRGTITGTCVPVVIDGRGSLVVKGVVRNVCAAATDSGRRLTLIGRQGYQVDSAIIESSGDLLVTNDPVIADAEVEPGAPSPAAGPATAALAPNDCFVSQTRLATVPNKAAVGSSGRTGGSGRDAARLLAWCRGVLNVQGAVRFVAQHGGDGGAGLDQPGSGAARATGGTGGKGGLVDIRATGQVLFTGLQNEMVGGEGGVGGNALAIAGADPAGPTAPIAGADAGKGGAPGLVSIRAVQRIDFGAVTKITVGRGGRGGNATAAGAKGADAAGPTTPAQEGGWANAEGGGGGDAPNLRLTPQNLIVDHPANLEVGGGGGGAGGEAVATGGEGGKGIAGRPDGGKGGESSGLGGRGGTAGLRNHLGAFFGPGGSGGLTVLRGALGGAGVAQCQLPLGLLPGGKGGDGGRLAGLGGLRGAGTPDGADGVLGIQSAGNGGNGGHGEPEGVGGAGGTANLPANVVRTGLNRAPGRPGFPCISAGGDYSVVVNGTRDRSPCPRTAFTQQIASFSPNSVAFEIAENVPFFQAGPISGLLAPAPGPTTEWSTSLVEYGDDRCLMQDLGLVQGIVGITYRLGPTSVTKSFNVRYEFRP